MADVRFLLSGDSSVTVEFGNEISPAINAQIRAFTIALEESKLPGIVEVVPTYRSLMVHYDPGVILYDELVKELKGLMGQLSNIQIPPSDVLEIPVLYGGEAGPDLDFVAEHNHKTPEEVVKIHTSTEYLIYMLGFTPGFTYLGGMSDEIATPRLKQPRVKIPAGSVGIAGSQTGVYPIDSPGGWQLIGQTPVRMYDPDRAEPILPKAGEYIKFYSITQAEFDAIAAQEAAGTYVCKRHPRKEGATMSITVLNPGLLTTVQDMGRIGYQQFGVSVSGVMDPRAAATANILVGNPEDEAVLECTMLGPQLRFDAANTIALTGGDLMASLDGQPVPTYRAIAVQAGQTLRFQAPKTGCRAYIAFTGGLDIPLVMGSRSTYMKAKIGGVQGGKLQKDDVIGFRAPGAPKNLNEPYITPSLSPARCTPSGW